MVESKMTESKSRLKACLTTTIAAVAAFAAAVWLSGCGNFWQNPYGTNTGTTASTTTLSAPSTATVGTTVTLTAMVSPSAATGTVTFYNGATSVGSASLSSGTATTTTSFATAGSESLTATYGGSSTYASSTSSAVTVTVSAAAAGGVRNSKALPVASPEPKSSDGVTTSAYGAAAIDATRAFSAEGGRYAARNAEAVVVDGDGAVSLRGTALSAAAGAGRGILLYQSGAGAGKDLGFAMSGGSLIYSCDATSTPACAEGSAAEGQSRPATLFAVANTKATILLTNVDVTNETSSAAHSDGTLLTAAAADRWGTTGANGGDVIFDAKGTSLTGDVIVDAISTAELSLVEDDSGTGSSLTGAINNAGAGGMVSLTIDRASLWTVTGTSHLGRLDGLDVKDGTVGNIDGGGHCVYYSGEINGAKSTKVYALSGSGYLAPAGTEGLKCE